MRQSIVIPGTWSQDGNHIEQPTQIRVGYIDRDNGPCVLLTIDNPDRTKREQVEIYLPPLMADALIERLATVRESLRPK